MKAIILEGDKSYLVPDRKKICRAKNEYIGISKHLAHMSCRDDWIVGLFFNGKRDKTKVRAKQ